VTDPANMWGSVLPWPATLGTDVRVRRVPGARVVTDDGHPVLYLGPKNKHLVVFEAAVIDPVRLDRVVAALKGTLGYRSMSIDMVNGATVSTSEQTPLLLRAGFERSFKGLVLSRG
jgi:ATP-dependent Lhr-like helicase